MQIADETRRRATLVVEVLLAFGLAYGVPRVARAQGDCKAVFDADDKMLATDHHSYTTKTGVQRETSESAMVSGANYLQVKGQWMKSPLTVAEVRAQKLENRKNAKNVSCQFLRDETIAGEKARVYRAHSETEVASSDVTVWISTSRGLPLQQEQEIDVGGGAAKTRYSIRYDYANVSVPAVH